MVKLRKQYISLLRNYCECNVCNMIKMLSRLSARIFLLKYYDRPLLKIRTIVYYRSMQNNLRILTLVQPENYVS
jgi:hypothetical protein